MALASARHWLPDRSALAVFAASSVLALIAWTLLFVGLESTPPAWSPEGVYFIAALLLLGPLYGSFLTAAFFLLSAVLKVLDKASRFWMSPARAVRVAVPFLVVHLLLSGAMFAMGLWGFKWSWYFGLFPGLG